MKYRPRMIEAYGHNNRIGVLVELELDTELTAQVEEVKQLSRDIALQVAALSPTSVSALLHSDYVKNPEISVGEHMHAVGKRVGERISISRFVRWDNEVPVPPLPPDPSDSPEDPALAKRA